MIYFLDEISGRDKKFGGFLEMVNFFEGNGFRFVMECFFFVGIYKDRWI